MLTISGSNMNTRTNSLQVAIFNRSNDKLKSREVSEFRKKLFVDYLGWNLNCNGHGEVDQFDTEQTLYAALYSDDQLIGSFRAIRSDQPYLAEIVFPALATTRTYPKRTDVWEISRFGVLTEGNSKFASDILYATMFHFALMRRAKALVAVTDLYHERHLTRLGIRTRRYGVPLQYGLDARGRPIFVVGGEIPVDAQDASNLRNLLSNLNGVSLNDQTLVFGRSRIQA